MASFLKCFARGSSLNHGQKAPGTCWFASISHEPKPACSIKADTLKTDLFETSRIYLFNCDAVECRAFLSKVLKVLSKMSFDTKITSKQQQEYDFEKYHYHYFNFILLDIHFHLCSLDRACMHILAELRGYRCVTVLCNGTRIVSFENEQDLIDCFTSLNLERVNQFESYMPALCSNEFSKQVDQDQRELENDKAREVPNRLISQIENDNLHPDVKLEELYELDFPTFDKHNYPERRNDFWISAIHTCVELQFFVPSTAVQIPPRSNNVKNRSQKAFQVQVNVESRRNLSAITLLALKVPTLRSIEIAGEHAPILQQNLLKVLKDSPATNIKSMDIIVYLRDKAYFYVSDELLDIFNEKKLARMKVFLPNKASFYLLDKVVDTISKSIYLQKLEFEMKPMPYETEDWVKVCEFMGKLVKVAPTLIRPLEYIRFEFLYDGPCNLEFMTKARESLLRIEKIMSAMEDKHLQILDVLVGATMFEPRKRNCPVAMLPPDIFRALKTFLVSGEDMG